MIIRYGNSSDTIAKIEEVMRLTGYKSTRSIYTILHDNGVDLQFPSMKRERKREENPQ